MVGHEDAVDAGVNGLAGVVRTQDALEDDRQPRDRLEPLDVTPLQRLVPNSDLIVRVTGENNAEL